MYTAARPRIPGENSNVLIDESTRGSETPGTKQAPPEERSQSKHHHTSRHNRQEHLLLDEAEIQENDTWHRSIAGSGP